MSSLNRILWDEYSRDWLHSREIYSRVDLYLRLICASWWRIRTEPCPEFVYSASLYSHPFSTTFLSLGMLKRLKQYGFEKSIFVFARHDRSLLRRPFVSHVILGTILIINLCERRESCAIWLCTMDTTGENFERVRLLFLEKEFERNKYLTNQNHDNYCSWEIFLPCNSRFPYNSRKNFQGLRKTIHGEALRIWNWDFPWKYQIP